jgi:Plasmid stabilization system protein
MKKYDVIWSNTANKSLRKIHDRIKENSPSGAIRVVNGLWELSQKLQNFPNGHSIDLRLIDQPIVYRVVSKWSYQLIYTVEEQNDRVVIVQVFNSKQNPDKFKL